MREHLQDRIARNRRNSWFLIFAIILLLCISGFFIGQALAVGWWGTLIAFVVSTGMALFSFYFGDQLVLILMGARRADPEAHRPLYNIVQEMCLAGGLPMPAVYVIESDASNAFATGRNPQKASIAATTGILEILNREELQAVIGHEMSHVRHHDMLYATMMAVMVGTIAVLCDAFWRMVRFGRFRSRGRGGGGGIAIIYLVAMLLAIVAPIVAKLIQLAMSRQREYLADAGGAELTRNPLALARALEKIAGDRDPLDMANRGVQHMFIVNPLSPLSESESLLSTHPPVAKRVAFLKQLANEYRT